ncbi:MAG: dephospho-CoA kinase [Planctomycetota bacterium]
MTGAERPMVIGLAGGIGAGKSAVASAFAELGLLVSDSDRAAKAMLDRDEVSAMLVEWWGERVLDATGRVDRAGIAAIVFEQPHERERLEALVHPLLKAGRSELIERARTEGAPGVVIDAPLLFEAGLDEECDAVVFVAAPRAVRLERLRRDRGWDEHELARRERAQWPIERKREGCSHEIDNAKADNSAGRAGLIEAARGVLGSVRAGRAGG